MAFQNTVFLLQDRRRKKVSLAAMILPEQYQYKEAANQRRRNTLQLTGKKRIIIQVAKICGWKLLPAISERDANGVVAGVGYNAGRNFFN